MVTFELSSVARGAILDGMPATKITWTRVDDAASNDIGYQIANGRIRILDNGAGLGGSKDSGRWALMVDGKWIANIDTLAAAKARALAHAA